MADIPLETRALALLARREHTRAELKKKLAPHADSEEELEQLLDRLAERHWQSDSRFAEQWINLKAARHGAARLKHDLRQHGVDADTISEALEELKDSEAARCHALWLKKFGTLPQTPQEKAKQIRFLASRGFALGVIQQAMREVDWDE